MALAIDKQGTRYREQAFQVVRYEDGTTGLQFLFPAEVKNAVKKAPWVLDPEIEKTSHEQLTAHMRSICDLKNSFPSHPKTYGCFEVFYDVDMKRTGGKFHEIEATVGCLDFGQCSRIQEPDAMLDPDDTMIHEVFEQVEFAKSILIKRGIMNETLPGRLLSRCLSMEINRGADEYLHAHNLQGFQAPLMDTISIKEDQSAVLGPLGLAREDGFSRITTYGREVDQHLNLMQCLAFEKTSKPFVKPEDADFFVEEINVHDARIARIQQTRLDFSENKNQRRSHKNKGPDNNPAP